MTLWKFFHVFDIHFFFPTNHRRWILERRLADADVSEEEQMNILKYLEKKETEYMRLQRHKMGVDDFELLTIIGRGAFGEVLFCFLCLKFLNLTLWFHIYHVKLLLLLLTLPSLIL